MPVVFHILTSGKGFLITEKMKCRMDDTLLIANKDFNGLFPEFNKTDSIFDTVKSKLPINFVLVTIDLDDNDVEVAGMDWQIDAHNCRWL
ncbi:hypothetical protein ACN1CN_19470 [Flavobacterium sp. T12S277]